jgi:S1-C subfamily serine protease
MKKIILLSAVLLLIATGCSLEGVATLGGEEQRSPQARSIEFDQSQAPAPASDLADMIEEVLPSVVNVRVQAVSFGPLGEAQVGEGIGSGVVIDESGIIMTNNHVVSGATEVSVVFNDESEVEGEVIGASPEHDIAVVQVDTDEELQAVTLGNSSSLRLGDEVVAIGFPLDLGDSPTVTKGIVSALDRDIDISNQDPSLPSRLEDLIQVDAAINPGNSGGPLLDAAGRLVGINTAAASAGAAENVGFATPIDVALPVAEGIIEDPPEQRPYLGVQIQDLTPDAAAQLGLDPDTEGALVAGLFPDGPAEDGGIEVEDVIVDIGGNEVTNAEGVSEALAGFEPGDVVEVTVLRDGSEEVIEIELERRPTTLN